jgi:hypothetical protein
MSEAGSRTVLIINPLKRALAHYEDELAQTLSYSGINVVEIADSVPGDWVVGTRQRVAIAARTVRERMRMARSVRGQTIIVTWPLFGHFEPLTLWRLARHNTVYLIVHDPLALRRSSGESSWASRLFKTALDRRSIEVLYHTAHAQCVSAHDNGVEGTVVPHPIRLGTSRTDKPRDSARPVVRVLGQYKRTRSLTALAAIADQAAGSYELEIHGHGWPDVDGWTVADRFIPEGEFTVLVESSDCVVIAYDSFFQSGVAARCLEAGVPVVAPDNEHIVQLYGDDWAGIVRDGSDWYDATVRALEVGAAEIHPRQLRVAREVRSAWHGVLSRGSEIPNTS